jgi:hypothetical protein
LQRLEQLNILVLDQGQLWPAPNIWWLLDCGVGHSKRPSNPMHPLQTYTYLLANHSIGFPPIDFAPLLEASCEVFLPTPVFRFGFAQQLSHHRNTTWANPKLLSPALQISRHERPAKDTLVSFNVLSHSILRR